MVAAQPYKALWSFLCISPPHLPPPSSPKWQISRPPWQLPNPSSSGKSILSGSHAFLLPFFFPFPPLLALLCFLQHFTTDVSSVGIFPGFPSSVGKLLFFIHPKLKIFALVCLILNLLILNLLCHFATNPPSWSEVEEIYSYSEQKRVSGTVPQRKASERSLLQFVMIGDIILVIESQNLLSNVMLSLLTYSVPER